MAEKEFVVSIEDICARKVDKRVDNSSQPSGSHEKVSTLIQEKVRSPTYSSWEEKLDRLMKEDEQGGQRFRKPKIIQRVPPILRDQNNFVKYFEPRAFSIGPLHYGNTKDADKYKPKLAKSFIMQRSTDRGKDLFMKIWNKIEELRDCFDEEVTKNWENESLAWMLFLDGCSTLQFIHILLSFGNNGLKKLIYIRNDQIAFAQQDLFLLENQLPYQVLKLLMNDDDEEDNKNDDDKKKKKKKSSNINKYKESINMFIRTNPVVPPNYMHKLFVDVESKRQEPAHLLELLQMSHLVVDHHQQPIPIEDMSNQYDWPDSYRSAKELNNVGITFKPNKSGTFRDVAFATRFLLFGELTLAPLIIDDVTKCMLLNMVAWETCSTGGPGDDFWVTSYICFINSLLRDAEDVKVLTSHNILLNYLGNEQQVVDLFHDISNNLIPNPYAYLRVYAGIGKHLRSKVKLLIAEWLHAHFSNTWALLAFLGAIFAIALTLVQTYFTANPPNKG